MLYPTDNTSGLGKISNIVLMQISLWANGVAFVSSRLSPGQ